MSAGASLLPREASEIAPGAVHVPDWLSIERRRELVRRCREWASGPAPKRHTRLPGGAVMSVQTVCLGWHWAPSRYARTAEDVDGAPITPFPGWLGERGREAVARALGALPARGHRPDAALIDFYDDGARLAMHRDRLNLTLRDTGLDG